MLKDSFSREINQMTTFEIVIVCLLAAAFLMIINLHYSISKILDILESHDDDLGKTLECLKILKGLIK